MELNGTHQFLVCSDEVNLPSHNINTINKMTETLQDASKGINLV
jgi:hypothetical protein